MMSNIFSLFRLRLRCLFPIFTLLSLLFLDCSSSGAEPDNTKNVNTTAGSTPLTAAAIPKKWEKYHYWGNYRLESNGDSYQLDTLSNQYRYRINEIRPGILSLNRGARHEEDADRFPPNLIALEFYDTLTHQLKKRVDLEKASPYQPGSYKKLQVGGGIDGEYMEQYGPDSTCKWPVLPKPDRFITKNSLQHNDYGQHICIGFTLIHIAGVKVVGWGETIGVFDLSGEQILQYKTDKGLEFCAVPASGKYFCYVTSPPDNSPPSPMDDCTNRLVVYDIQQKKEVFRREYSNCLISMSSYSKFPNEELCFQVTCKNTESLFWLNEKEQAIGEYEMTKENWENVRIKKSINDMVKNSKPLKKYNL